MPNLEQIAITAARALSPKLAAQAEKELKNYTKDKDGLQKVIARYGGEAFLDKAVNFANTAPRVKRMFSQFGINPNDLKINVMRELQNHQSPAKHTIKSPDGALPSAIDRLKKLR